MASIAKHAVVSQGVVVFHFKTKDSLLEQTLRHMNNDYANYWKTAYNNADDNSMTRLCALVEAVFSPAVYTPKLLGVWYAFEVILILAFSIKVFVVNRIKPIQGTY